MTTTEQVFSELVTANRDMTPAELVRSTGLPHYKVVAALGQLKDKRRVVTDGRVPNLRYRVLYV